MMTIYHGYNLINTMGDIKMKYVKTKNMFKASNLTLDMNTLESRSYNWYILSKVFNNTLVLNTYNYSPTTLRHVSKVRSVLFSRDIKYFEIDAPRGLQDLSSALLNNQLEINKRIEKINKPRTQQKTKDKLNLEIAALNDKKILIETLMRD